MALVAQAFSVGCVVLLRVLVKLRYCVSIAHPRRHHH